MPWNGGVEDSVVRGLRVSPGCVCEAGAVFVNTSREGKGCFFTFRWILAPRCRSPLAPVKRWQLQPVHSKRGIWKECWSCFLFHFCYGLAFKLLHFRHFLLLSTAGSEYIYVFVCGNFKPRSCLNSFFYFHMTH